MPRGSARERLLDAVIAHIATRGISDLSLRELAAGVGTSHRMLIHHFGSRDGLLTEVVRTVEAQQRGFLATLDPAASDISTAMWQRLSDPTLWPAERLFFECYARAARGEQPYASLLPGLVDDWLGATTSMSGPGPHHLARARARLSLALFRGLLLDLVGTEDRAGVDGAFKQYLVLERLAIEDRPTRRT